MALSSVTTKAAFGVAGKAGLMYQVNPGFDARVALGEAQCIMDYVHTRLQESVQDGMNAEESYALALLQDMMRALFVSIGSEA